MTQLTLFDDQEMRQVRKPGQVRGSNDAYKDYAGFVEKFKTAHTTDDCFTPPAVYEAVLRFVGEELADTDTRPVVRPFYPGGNYKELPYPDGCIVIDNPPFSIYTEIVMWYCARGIDFFLFAPHLTIASSSISAHPDVCFLLCEADIIYENGASVNTSFTTSLCPGLRIWTCPKLKRMVEEAVDVSRPKSKPLPRYELPANVLTAARAGKFATVDFRVRKDECVWIRELDSMRPAGKSLFGNGFLLSDRAAAEKAAAEKAAAEKAAAEKAAAEKAAAEKAAEREAVVWELSEREKEIIRKLNDNPEMLKGGGR